MYINTEGIVRKSVKYKDSDAILTLFSKKMSKVTVYAKNVRKMNHNSRAVSQSFAYGNFVLRTQGKMLQLSSFECKENFYFLTEDIDKTFLAYYFVELSEKLLVENQTNHRLLQALLDSLYALKDIEKYELVKLYFECKALRFCGYQPQVSKCLKCGIIRDNSIPFYFQVEDGGVYCYHCKSETEGHNIFYTQYDNTTYQLLDFMMRESLQQVMQAEISSVILKELDRFVRQYYSVHLGELQLKSVDFVRHIAP